MLNHGRRCLRLLVTVELRSHVRVDEVKHGLEHNSLHVFDHHRLGACFIHASKELGLENRGPCSEYGLVGGKGFPRDMKPDVRSFLALQELTEVLVQVRGWRHWQGLLLIICS